MVEEYSLVGVDGNAFSIMGYVTKAMQETGFTKNELYDYREQAMSSDYNHLVAVSTEMIKRCNERLNKGEFV